jgi:6-phosphogluconolactonase (cycloisomerase 2 family)
MDPTRIRLTTLVASVLLLAGSLASCGGGSSPVLVSIQLAPADQKIIRGETQQFTATGTYSDHSMSDLTTTVVWLSSDTATASISNTAGSTGLATAANLGAATISATLDGISGSTLLTIVARPEVLYVMNTSAIYQYSIGQDGKLSPLKPANIPELAWDMRIDRNGEHAYAIGGLGILQFSIEPNGPLTPMTPSSVPAQILGAKPANLVMHPSGKFAYAFSAGEPGTGGGPMLRFDIGSDAALQTPPTIVGGGNIVEVGMDPKGRYAYASYYGDYTGDSTLVQYSIHSDGSLSFISPTPIALGIQARGIVTDPQGLHLYVAVEGSGRILQYAIGNDGLLKPLNPPFVSMLGPRAMAVHPNGRYLYVGSETPFLPAASVSFFTILADGTLEPMNPPSVACRHDPLEIVIEPSGRFVYTANYQDNSISEYAVAGNGTLVPIGVVPLPAGQWAFSIAATR